MFLIHLWDDAYRPTHFMTTFVDVKEMLGVVLSWVTVVIFSFAMLFYPVSVGRALLFAISPVGSKRIEVQRIEKNRENLTRTKP